MVCPRVIRYPDSDSAQGIAHLVGDYAAQIRCGRLGVAGYGTQREKQTQRAARSAAYVSAA